MKENKEELIYQFMNNQSLTSIQELKNIGITIKHIVHQKWVNVTSYILPIERYIILYDNNLMPNGIGVY